jgi:acyl-CoA synthetase (AMP-forming)/AMP-acid ligase II
MTWRFEQDVGGFPVRRSAEVAAQYEAAGYWRDETLADVARTRTREDPARTLLIEGERRISRGEAFEQARRLAAFFAARGLAAGDVVSFQLPNWIESAVIALAVRLAGLIINPIPPIYREAELGYIAADCGAKLIFIPDIFRGFDHVALIEKLRPRLPTLKDVVVVRGERRSASTWEDALAFAPVPEADLPKVDPSAVMMAMYTSGTTARAKGVLHSHHTFDFKVRQMAEVWALSSDDVFFMPSPVTHITGAFWSVDMPWVCGASSVLMDVWSAEEGVRCIQANGCTVSGGATPFLQQLLEVAHDRPEALRTLRIFFCGGTAVSPDLVKRAAAAFPNGLFFRAYGCTEMPCTTMGIHGPAQARLGAETDGEVLLPTETKLVVPDVDGSVADGEEGEILARGPEQFLGYLHPEDNEGAFDAEGFFHTGDLGRRVHGDYLVITGRKKDIIIRSGENISPKEVEDVLFDHPDIAEVAIVAMPSPTTGEKGCAFVIPRGDAVVDLPSIRRFLTAAGLARQKFPEHVVIVKDLPRVPSGKVRKDVLREEARRIGVAHATSQG